MMMLDVYGMELTMLWLSLLRTLTFYLTLTYSQHTVPLSPDEIGARPGQSHINSIRTC